MQYRYLVWDGCHCALADHFRIVADARASLCRTRKDWLDAARRLADFLLGPLSDEKGRLLRTLPRAAKTSRFLEDYADVANGSYELHVATGELRWLEEAHRLARLAVELFADEERGGFFLSPADGEELVARTKDLRRPPDAVRELDAPVLCFSGWRGFSDD